MPAVPRESASSVATTTAKAARAEATRAALVDAATTLFHDRGYGATTAADIAAAIGQTKGAFYFHFASKDQCFLETLAHREHLRGEWYRIPRQHDPATTSLPALLALTLAQLAASMQGRPSFSLAMVDFWLATPHRDQIAEAFARTYTAWIREITAYVTALQDGGWVDAAQDPAVLAAQLFALVEGYQLQAQLYGADLADVVDGMVKLLRPRE